MGANIIVPDHQYIAGSLSGAGDFDWYDINVTNADYPIAVAMIMPNWTGSASPDFDMKLYLSNGTTQVGSSEGILRHETIGYQPASAGTYKLRVYQYAGSGNYFLDISARTAVISITLTTDGNVNFGTVALNASKDTTPSGINDPENVRVDAGPADLAIRSTDFSDGSNAWNLGNKLRVATKSNGIFQKMAVFGRISQPPEQIILLIPRYRNWIRAISIFASLCQPAHYPITRTRRQ